MTQDNAPQDIALYVHWPFCERKCPYCDFNSHVTEAVDQARWRAALLADLGHYAAETPGRRLTSVFFGGGTPSLMAPETVTDILAATAGHWAWDEAPEITLEANPSSAERGRFRAYRDAGVNRLSIGVQSFENDALRFLGRLHDAAQADDAVAAAREIFTRVSFDMIYARPGQDAASWRRELSEALQRAGEHLSLYQLTIEPGTAFFRDAVDTADEDASIAMYEITQDAMAAAGLPAYEISNHARPGAESRHNLTYWRGDDYIGIGPGAHGRLTTDVGFVAPHQISDPARWLAAVEAKGHGTAKRRPLSAAERAEEMVMTGLRLNAGLDLIRLRRKTGLEIAGIIAPERQEKLIETGFITVGDGRMQVTADGRLRLNSVLAHLLAPIDD